MTEIASLNNIENLKVVSYWMMDTIIAYETGSITKKHASALTKIVLRKLKKYAPTDKEKSNYDIILDLCISLSTIDRADGVFEKFYLESLKEELKAINHS